MHLKLTKFRFLLKNAKKRNLHRKENKRGRKAMSEVKRKKEQEQKLKRSSRNKWKKQR